MTRTGQSSIVKTTLCLMAILLCFSAAPNANAASWMNRVQNFAVQEDAGNVIATQDGGYAVAGNVTLADQWVSAIIKLDQNGDMQWIKSYSPGGASDIALAPNGQLLLLVERPDGVSSWLGAIDSNGAIVNQTIIGNSLHFLTVDGNDAYLTSRWEAGDGITVVKVDTSSLAVGTSTHFITEDNELTISSTAVDGDGDFFVLGRGTVPFLIHTNSNLSTPCFMVMDGGDEYHLTDLSIDQGNNNILMTGYKTDDITGYDIVILQLREVDFSVLYGSILATPRDEWCHTVSSYGGYHFFGCSANSFSPIGDPSDMLTIRLRASDMSIRSRTRYSTPDRDEGYMGVATPDGGTLMAGWHEGWNGNGPHTIFVKAGATGAVGAINHSGAAISPNPYVENISSTDLPATPMGASFTGAPVQPASFTPQQSTATEVESDISMSHWIHRMTN